MYWRGWVKRDHLSFGVQFWALEIFLLKCNLSPVYLETSLKDLWFGSRILVYVWGDTGHLIDYNFTTMTQLWEAISKVEASEGQVNSFWPWKCYVSLAARSLQLVLLLWYVATVLRPKGLILRPLKSVAQLSGASVMQDEGLKWQFHALLLQAKLGILSLGRTCWIKKAGVSFCFALDLYFLKSVLYSCSLEK